MACDVAQRTMEWTTFCEIMSGADFKAAKDDLNRLYRFYTEVQDGLKSVTRDERLHQSVVIGQHFREQSSQTRRQRKQSDQKSYQFT